MKILSESRMTITDLMDYTDGTDLKSEKSVKSLNPWQSVMQTRGEKKVRGHLGKMGFAWK